MNQHQINMYEEIYTKAIDKIKEVYPQYKDAKFAIDDGLISWRYESKYDIDIDKLQLFVNDFLGQKVYRIEYVGY